MIEVLILISLLLIASLYINWNLYKKYESLEEIALENEEFIKAIRNRVMSQQSYLKQLDRKGAFESDDEVGYFFKELKKIINDIAGFVEIENDVLEESRERIINARSVITSEF